jgi:hypothetical protein
MLISGIMMSTSALAVNKKAHSKAASDQAQKSVAGNSNIPRLPNGKPDFSGIWEATTAANYDLEPHANRKGEPPFAGIVEGGTIPYLPKALEQKKKNFENRETLDPALKGYTLGVPRGIYYPEPFQIFQRNNDLFLDFQFGHSVRTIYTNGTEHPEDPLDWWFGDSRGRWDGDTLIVDVKHFNDKTWFDHAGNYHSDALHIVEKWKFLDANTIEYTATIEDTNVYSRPWTISVLLHRHREKNFQLIEDYRFTLDYDQYYPPKPDSK